jgi:ribosomal protein S18 acetylase RimI-like enzyme
MNSLKDLPSDSDVTFALRNDLRPGDLGALISLHGTVYAREFGFDSTFEAHVARLLGEFVHERTDHDGFWIAERGVCLVGSIAVVGRSGRDCELCWLLVEPSARSLGLGRRLLHAAVEFCRGCRYEYVSLRSFRVLTAASHLFRSVGFEKVAEKPRERWGVAVVEECYALHPFGRRHPSPGALAFVDQAGSLTPARKPYQESNSDENSPPQELSRAGGGTR